MTTSEVDPVVPAVPEPVGTDTGLRKNSIGLLANVGVGVGATTPAVSVALFFGVLAASVGVRIPAALLVAFVPILLISLAYRRLNEADPDCGTVFSWATKAFGPYVGWFGGWIVVAALAVVVTNFAQLLGLYSFLLFDWTAAADSVAATTALGSAWFVLLTVIAYRGIELSKNVQLPLLAFELAIFSLFAVVAIIKGGANDPKGSVTPSLSWLDPTALSSGALAVAVTAAVVIYWGWDTSVMVNEESEHRTHNPGLAAVISTVVLVGFYVLLAFGLVAFAGPDRLAGADGDVISMLAPEVFGGTADRLLILAGLTSAIAGCLFLPIGGARTMLSMARDGALPPRFAEIHARFRTPSIATLVFAGVSLVYFIGMTIISESVLLDSLTALGLLVAIYYALTGFSCVVYFRRRLAGGPRNLLMLGVAPLAGAVALTYVLYRTASDLTKGAEGGLLGMGGPITIAIVIVVLGLVGSLVSRAMSPAFFDRGLEAAPADPRD